MPTASVDHFFPHTSKDTFEFLLNSDPILFLPGYKGLPGIAAQHLDDGAWTEAGRGRTLTLTDGTSVHEVLTLVQRSELITYKVTGYQGLMEKLVSHAEGRWVFAEEGENTRVIWTYRYFAKNRLAFLPVWLITKTIWRAYMRDGLHNLDCLMMRAQNAPQ